MSSPNSWLLSVQEFFSFTHWQSQPPESFNEQQSLLTAWQCLSVQEFFSFTHWQSQPRESFNEQYQHQFLQLTLQAEAAIACHLDSWQCLSVQEFFSFIHWQGQPHEKFSWHDINQSSSLTLQVSEFFKLIDWEGHPEIGSLPKKLLPPNSFEAPVKTTVTDLSTLF
ncbi:hypothetical protein ABN584_21650 [Gloeocapsa sp. BRSZ]